MSPVSQESGRFVHLADLKDDQIPCGFRRLKEGKFAGNVIPDDMSSGRGSAGKIFLDAFGNELDDPDYVYSAEPEEDTEPPAKRGRWMTRCNCGSIWPGASQCDLDMSLCGDYRPVWVEDLDGEESPEA
jgi:hypothetical protein